MSIHFTPERWQEVRQNARLWWQGELGRPLFCLTHYGMPADRPAAKHAGHGFTAFYDPSVTAEEIVDVWDYQLSTCAYLGDGFPTVWPNFGPGVAAAFLGADLFADGRHSVWFRPKERRPLQDLHFEIDLANAWLQRVMSIYQAGARRWGSQVLMGMTDLGGTLDVLSTFRPGEELLFDLYDDPETVKRLTWEIHECWWRYYGLFTEALPDNPGSSGWAGFYSEPSSYMLQCDFAYMIGPEMFDEFVKPELAASCRRLANAFYHLDGPGQLPHLDSLLAIPELKGIQWVPGDGQPDVSQWPDVYRRIREAGKLVQVFTGQCRGGLEIVDVLAGQLGSAEGIVVVGGVGPSEVDNAREILSRYGAA